MASPGHATHAHGRHSDLRLCSDRAFTSPSTTHAGLITRLLQSAPRAWNMHAWPRRHTTHGAVCLKLPRSDQSPHAWRLRPAAAGKNDPLAAYGRSRRGKLDAHLRTLDVSSRIRIRSSGHAGMPCSRSHHSSGRAPHRTVGFGFQHAYVWLIKAVDCMVRIRCSEWSVACRHVGHVGTAQ